MEGRAEPRPVASAALLAGEILAALDSLSETRVRGLDFSASTRTEPLRYLTDRQHQSSSTFSCELALDLSGFLQEDPSGFEGGLNLYTYAINMPILGTDPLGLASTYNPYRDCVEKATKACKGKFRFACKVWGGYKGPELDAVVKRCLDLAPQRCSFLPDTDVPKKDKRRYDQQTEDFTEKCKKNCPASKMTCDEFLDCIAKQKP